jgi:hypothetical protein
MENIVEISYGKYNWLQGNSSAMEKRERAKLGL